ncbi:DUF4038 domain-containing protein [Collinsella sp. zg1085]|uniref:apiosidase-like domain-containing protein n=1 Tax=Collinsella sp. zg1085 TaxID=2844380 RepID=UPI001C0BF22F|nr:DUF4038 domain-containing protein [Collinsella sp. zg1085]QWT17210.1 DUF4038 domain-containing protein [Collinsella sp. zg1085]
MGLGNLTVNDAQDGFLLDGKPWFWLADTCWSAFTSISLEDWDYYLCRRAEQGINVLQVNTLPQWDRARPDLGVYPYTSHDGTSFDWTCSNPAFWERARVMATMAKEHGIRLALVLVWCNYVPGTWAANYAVGLGSALMPLDEARAHVRRVVAELGEFDPIYIVSGDTDFNSDETVAYYNQVLDELIAAAPQALRCMHVNRGNRTIPQSYLSRLHFYMYQPGHNYAAQFEAWKLPEDIRAAYPKKPLINSEPCYEQISSSRGVYRRFDAADCRASAWSGILAGACGGVTYGTHGVWNWNTSQSASSALGEGFDAAFRWQECLQFPGIWDFGLIPELLQHVSGGYTVEPAQDLLDDTREQIRVGRAGDKLIIYVPYATELRLTGVAALLGVANNGWQAKVFDLELKRLAHVGSVYDGKADTLRILQHSFTHDVLLVVEKR